MVIRMIEEINLLRELAKEYRELSAQEVNHERIQRIRRINGCVQDRPIVWIDEIPWHEMEIDHQLELRCTDPFAREMEQFFRRSLFQWNYFQADMVLRKAYEIKKSYETTGIGVKVKEYTLQSGDADGVIASHQYGDQLGTEEELERLHCPVIRADRERDRINLARAEEILQDILPVRLRGDVFYCCPWDDIATLRGVEPILLDLYDRPEFLHRTMKKMMEISWSKLEQMEREGLLDNDVPDLHCTPPYVDGLPETEATVKAKNVWYRGAAQMFSVVSQETWKELELDYVRPLMERFGLVYYGCCEPLDDRIAELKKIPNLRKIGVSPWADVRTCVEQMGSGYVCSRKPNPALLAGASLDRDAIRGEIRETLRACREADCACEFVLKDISTVGCRPQNLIQWNQIVQQEIDSF